MNTRHLYQRTLTALIGLLMLSFSAYAQQPAFLTNGLVAYYPFNGNANDESGQLNHFGTQLDFRTDRFGTSKGAPRFSSPRPINSKPITIPGSGFTISYWFYLESTPNQGGERFLLHGSHNLGWTSSGAASFGFAVWGDGRFGVSVLHDNLVGGSIGMPSGTISVGKWYHVGMSSGGGSTKLFINGNLSGIDPGTITTRTFPLTLGGEDSYFFQSGSIDDVRIYNRALSDGEVKALYNYEYTPPDNGFITNGLLAYYPFNGNAKDASGNGNDGVVTGATLTTDRFGFPDHCYLFNGFTDNILATVASIPINAQDRTLVLWEKLTASTTSTPFYVPAAWGLNNNNQAFGLLAWKVPKVWGVQFWGGGQDLNTTLSVDNDWHQIACILESNIAKIYYDGVLNATSGKITSTGFSQLFIGKGVEKTGTYFPGFIDDVRIYNRALSAGELSALYEYESVPQKTDPRQATAAATVVNGFVVGATITDGGSGYTKAPKVIIGGGGGSGATATATIDANGSVTGITIVSSGSKYTGIPTITIDAPPFPPSQAKGTATLINGFVTGVNITDGGHGYEGVIPPVTFLGGGGSGAKGIAIVSNGIVTGISMTASGSGYTKAPYALIAAPPGLARAEISVHSVDVTLHLIPGYTYKIQTAIDAGSTWVDVETGILAVDATLVRTFDVTTNTQLFRVVQVN